jgi:hypothetical protein
MSRINFSSPNYIAKIEALKHSVSYNLLHLYKIAEVVDFIPTSEKGWGSVPKLCPKMTNF